MFVGSSCAEAEKTPPPASAAIAAMSTCGRNVSSEAAGDLTDKCRRTLPSRLAARNTSASARRLGHRVHELIGLPEALLLLGEIHALLHEGLAVGVLVVDLIGSDTRHVGAMREHHAVQSIDHDAEIVVYELAGGLSIPV